MDPTLLFVLRWGYVSSLVAVIAMFLGGLMSHQESREAAKIRLQVSIANVFLLPSLLGTDLGILLSILVVFTSFLLLGVSYAFFTEMGNPEQPTSLRFSISELEPLAELLERILTKWDDADVEEPIDQANMQKTDANTTE